MQGSLTPSYGLADAVRGIYVGRRSGILTIARNTVEKRLFFEKGSFVFSETNQPARRFGDLLVARGKLTRADLDHVLALLAPGKRIGMVLRDLGYLDERSLAEAVEYQITENVYDVFSWESGEFQFVAKDEPAPSDIALAISTANVVLEGVRRIADVAFVRRALGPTDQVVSLGSNPLLRFQSINLKPKEGFILSRIDGVLTVDDVSAISPVPEDEVIRCIYGLKCTGILDVRLASEGAPPVEEEDANIASFFTDFGGVEQYLGASVTRTVEVDFSPEDRKEQAEILELAERISDLDHYMVLGIDARADGKAIRKAYYNLAKRYHPDRHHRTHLTNLQDKLERIFVRINEAYEVVKDEKTRAAYDRARAGGAPPSRDAAVEQAAATAADPHADALRRQHMAESSFREGKTLLDRGDIFGAIRSFQIAVSNQPERPAYQSYLGRTLAKNAKWRKEAEEHLLKAIELEPSEAEHYAQLGLLYENAKLPTRADRYFDEALKWDRGNATALGARARRGDETPRKDAAARGGGGVPGGKK